MNKYESKAWHLSHKIKLGLSESYNVVSIAILCQVAIIEKQEKVVNICLSWAYVQTVKIDTRYSHVGMGLNLQL